MTTKQRIATLTSIALSAVAVAFVTLLTPAASSAQISSEVTAPVAVPIARVDRCVAGHPQYEAEWTAMLASAELAPEPARATLAGLKEALELQAQARPTDVDLQYLLAVVVGASAEFETGRNAIQAAKDLHAQTETVLALDPEHPGAQHLLGRLHHAVMKMGRVQRFLATKVLGGSEFSGSSWDEAQSLLEAAVVGDPCVADHHFELARLYLDRGDSEIAYVRLEQLLRMDLTTARDRVVLERARGLLEELSN